MSSTKRFAVHLCGLTFRFANSANQTLMLNIEIEPLL